MAPLDRFMSRRPVSKGLGRRALLAAGFAGLAVASLLAWVGFNAPNSVPGRDYYVVTAELDDAENLTSHYQVRVAGRLVGQVLNPRVEHGKAIIDLQLEAELGPLRSDTQLRVRPRSPIGVRYVELYPGTKGTKLAEGARLDASQATASLPLDTTLSTFDAATRKRTQRLLAGLGGGFAGRGEDVSAALSAAPGFLKDTQRVTGAIADRSGAIDGFVQGVEAASGAADPVRDVIATGFAPEAAALKAVGDSASGIDALLRTSPASLRETRAGLTGATPVIAEVGALAHELRPLLAAAPSSLRRATMLMRESRPATRRLDRVLRTAQKAVAPTLRFLRVVRPVLPSLDNGLRAPLPILQDLGPRRCDIVQMVRNWESMFGWGQKGGNYLRFNVVASTESLTGYTQEGAPGLAPIRSTPYPEPCQKSKKGPR
jgi:ABC-type transporter Mla subunit MlaD